MAQKRMFDMAIVQSDRFLDMSHSAQCLYFHLGMVADDDGFVSPKKIIRMLGIPVDDLKLLIAKEFVIPFDDGVVVIKDWKNNNLIRSDRYKPTVYQDHLKRLGISDSNSYILAGIPMVYQMDTNGRHSIEENRIEQNRTENSKELEQSSDNKKENKSLSVEKKEYGNPDVNQAIQLLKDMNGGITQEKLNRYAVQRLITKYGVDSTLKAMQFAYKVRERQFAPLITNYIQLERKYPELTAYAQRLKDEKQNTTVAFYVAEAEEGGVVYG